MMVKNISKFLDYKMVNVVIDGYIKLIYKFPKILISTKWYYRNLMELEHSEKF